MGAAHAEDAKSGGTAQDQIPAEPSVTTASFGDWTLRCVRDTTEGASSACEVLQSVLIKEQSEPVAQVALGQLLPSKDLQLTVVLPTNVSFGASPAILLGETKADVIPLQWKRCMPGGCFATAQVDMDTLTGQKTKAGGGALTFLDAADRKVALPFSFRGLKQALQSLSQKTAN
jgi:invasion protein IalB